MHASLVPRMNSVPLVVLHIQTCRKELSVKHSYGLPHLKLKLDCLALGESEVKVKASAVVDWSTPHRLNSLRPELAPLLKRLAPTISSDSHKVHCWLKRNRESKD
jgi:hypothetical protein